MPSPPDPLETTDAVIDALGGNAATGAIVGASPKAVWNWREAARAKFPPETYVVLMGALKAIGLTALPSLWGMAEPAKAPAPAENAAPARPQPPRKRKAA